MDQDFPFPGSGREHLSMALYGSNGTEALELLIAQGQQLLTVQQSCFCEARLRTGILESKQRAVNEVCNGDSPPLISTEENQAKFLYI